MATTEDIAKHPQESGHRPDSLLGDSIDRAMADAERRLRRLVDRLHGAARGSPVFEGAKRDAERVLEWLQTRAGDLDAELRSLARARPEGQRGSADASSFDADVGGG